MRAADVVEKVSKQYPEYLQPFKRQLIHEIARIPQQEVRWHAAQMFSYLSLTSKERNQVIKILLSWIENEKSNIVRVMSLQTIADFTKQDKKIKNQIMPLLQKFVTNGNPSLRSRSKKLLREFAAKE